jgi:triacylglycerol lipase
MSPHFFRDPPQPAVRCRYPIVLLHGLFGFAQKKFGPIEACYFRGVVPYLQSAGNETRAIAVHPWQSIDYRARQIRDAIENDPFLRDHPLNLVGHSMGGLDARYLVSELGCADRVRSITSIASPHRGSFLADLCTALPGVGNLLPAIPNLTLKAMAEFNRKYPEGDRVVYLSIPAWTPFWKCCPLMWPTWLPLAIQGGKNDGQVTIESAEWGEVLEIKKSDHVQLIGMRYGLNFFDRENHLSVYGRITEALAERGL